MKDAAIHDLVDAWLASDERAIREAAEQLDGPWARAGQALALVTATRAVQRADLSEISQETLSRLKAIFESVESDKAQAALIAWGCCRLLCMAGDHESAKRWAGRIPEKATFGTQRLEGVRAVVLSEIHAAQDHFDAALKEVQSIAHLNKPRSTFGAFVDLQIVDCADRAGWLEMAQQHHRQMAENIDPEDLGNGLRWRFLGFNLAIAGADYADALSWTDNLTPEQKSHNLPRYLRARALALCLLERHADARQLIEDADDIGPGLRPFLEGICSFFECDHKRAIECFRMALPSMAEPLASAVIQSSMLLCHLSARNRTEARAILKQIDPDGSSLRHEFDRLRLDLLDGQPERARHRFQRLQHRWCNGQLEHQLRLSTELSAYQLATLQRPDSDTDQEAPAQAPHPDTQEQHHALIGVSTALSKVRQSIDRFAPTDHGVLITGETGTGKEVVAQLLHARSDRADAQMAPLNCGGISESIIESELFGHKRGAFTGADRDHEGLFRSVGRGTLFLDEVNAMPPRLQSTLLRVLENREGRAVGGTRTYRIDCRIIAASNQNLAELVDRGAFRSDLYFRLSQLNIELPPLRQRPEDIEPLCHHFLEQMGYAPGTIALSPQLLEAMQHHAWPGNVRELKNEIHRMVLLAGDQPILDFKHFSRTVDPVRQTDKPSADPDGMATNRPMKSTRERRAYIRQLFAQHAELTRARIIQLTGCSPGTATRDLRALADEGFIVRIETSGHLRTSYYRMADPDAASTSDR